MSELRQREPRVEDKAFLAYVRLQRCCVCGAPQPSQAAHVRMACLGRGKRATGKGERPSDRWAVPLCQAEHLDGPGAQHKGAEAAFWRRIGLDPFAIAAALYEEFLASGGVDRIARNVDSGRKVKAFTSAKASRSPKRPSQIKYATDSGAKVRRPKMKWPSRPLHGTTRWPKRKMRSGR